MKRRLWVIMMILFTLYPVSGQFNRARTFVMAGLTVGQVDGDPYSGYHKAGFWAGAGLEKQLFEDFSMRTELKFIQKGSSDGNQIEGTNTFYRMVLNYLEVPILAQYHTMDHLSFEAGPALAYLVHSSEKDENGTLFDAVPFNRLELSGNAGIHYLFLDRFALHFRFSYSILRIRAHAGGGTWYANRGQYNNLFSFGLGYRLSR